MSAIGPISGYQSGQVAYAETVVNTSIISTNPAAENVAVTLPSMTFNGVTRYKIEVGTAQWAPPSGIVMHGVVRIGATYFRPIVSSNLQSAYAARYLVLPAGTYAITFGAYVVSGGGTIVAGSGTAGQVSPCFIRLSLA